MAFGAASGRGSRVATGTYTFSARYLTEPGGDDNPLFIEYRSLSVIAL